jgi:hypothetical protein
VASGAPVVCLVDDGAEPNAGTVVLLAVRRLSPMIRCARRVHTEDNARLLPKLLKRNFCFLVFFELVVDDSKGGVGVRPFCPKTCSCAQREKLFETESKGSSPKNTMM